MFTLVRQLVRRSFSEDGSLVRRRKQVSITPAGEEKQTFKLSYLLTADAARSLGPGAQPN